MRATPHVSLDAAPNSGAAVYDSTQYGGQSGWSQVGGTSLITPMWAGRSADAGVMTNAAYIYGNNITFRDITNGNNGAACLTGFDLCSGLGSWTGATP
jgi:subtilase family serine protease